MGMVFGSPLFFDGAAHAEDRDSPSREPLSTNGPVSLENRLKKGRVCLPSDNLRQIAAQSIVREVYDFDHDNIQFRTYSWYDSCGLRVPSIPCLCLCCPD